MIYSHLFERVVVRYSNDSRWQGIQQVCRIQELVPAENITTKYHRYCFVSCWDLEVNLRDEKKKVSCKEFDGRRRVGPNCCDCDTDNIFRSNFTGCFKQKRIFFFFFLVWRPFTAHQLFCCCSFLSFKYIPLEIFIKKIPTFRSLPFFLRMMARARHTLLVIYIFLRNNIQFLRFRRGASFDSLDE